MVAVGAVSLEMIGWDAVAFELLLAAYVVRTFTHTSHLLFSNGSLVNYWRTELGGKPDEDDPYDIQPAVEVFKEQQAAASSARGPSGERQDVHGGLANSTEGATERQGIQGDPGAARSSKNTAASHGWQVRGGRATRVRRTPSTGCGRT